MSVEQIQDDGWSQWEVPQSPLADSRLSSLPSEESTILFALPKHVDAISLIDFLSPEAAQIATGYWTRDTIAEVTNRFEAFRQKHGVTVDLRFDPRRNGQSGIAKVSETGRDCIIIALQPSAINLAQQPKAQLRWLDWFFNHEIAHHEQKKLLRIDDETLKSGTLNPRQLRLLLRGMRNWGEGSHIPPLISFCDMLESHEETHTEKRRIALALMELHADSTPIARGSPSLIAQGLFVSALTVEMLHQVQNQLTKPSLEDLMSLGRTHSCLQVLSNLLETRGLAASVSFIEQEYRGHFAHAAVDAPFIATLHKTSATNFVRSLAEAFSNEVRRLLSDTEWERYNRVLSGMQQFLLLSVGHAELVPDLDSILKLAQAAGQPYVASDLFHFWSTYMGQDAALLDRISEERNVRSREAMAQLLTPNSITGEQYLQFRAGCRVVRSSDPEFAELENLASPTLWAQAQAEGKMYVKLTDAICTVGNPGSYSVEATQVTRALKPNVSSDLVPKVLRDLCGYASDWELWVGFGGRRSLENQVGLEFAQKFVAVAGVEHNYWIKALAAQFRSGELMQGGTIRGYPCRLKHCAFALGIFAAYYPDEALPVIKSLLKREKNQIQRFALLQSWVIAAFQNPQILHDFATHLKPKLLNRHGWKEYQEVLHITSHEINEPTRDMIARWAHSAPLQHWRQDIDKLARHDSPLIRNLLAESFASLLPHFPKDVFSAARNLLIFEVSLRNGYALAGILAKPPFYDRTIDCCIRAINQSEEAVGDTEVTRVWQDVSQIMKTSAAVSAIMGQLSPGFFHLLSETAQDSKASQQFQEEQYLRLESLAQHELISEIFPRDWILRIDRWPEVHVTAKKLAETGGTSVALHSVIEGNPTEVGDYVALVTGRPVPPGQAFHSEFMQEDRFQAALRNLLSPAAQEELLIRSLVDKYDQAFRIKAEELIASHSEVIRSYQLYRYGKLLSEGDKQISYSCATTLAEHLRPTDLERLIRINDLDPQTVTLLRRGIDRGH